MAPLKLHLKKVNSYWKWLSGKLDLKSFLVVVSRGFKNRAYKFSEKRGGTIGELSIRIDRGLENFYLLVIQQG